MFLVGKFKILIVYQTYLKQAHKICIQNSIFCQSLLATVTLTFDLPYLHMQQVMEKLISSSQNLEQPANKFYKILEVIGLLSWRGS